MAEVGVARMVEQPDGSMQVQVSGGVDPTSLGVVNSGDGMFEAADQVLARHGWQVVRAWEDVTVGGVEQFVAAVQR